MSHYDLVLRQICEALQNANSDALLNATTEDAFVAAFTTAVRDEAARQGGALCATEGQLRELAVVLFRSLDDGLEEKAPHEAPIQSH